MSAEGWGGEKIDHDDWAEAHPAQGISSVYDLERPTKTRPCPRKVAPARLLTIDQWNAIAALAPADLKWRDVLIASSRRGKTPDIARDVGRTPRPIRQIQGWHLAWSARNLAPGEAGMRLDDPITT